MFDVFPTGQRSASQRNWRFGLSPRPYKAIGEQNNRIVVFELKYSLEWHHLVGWFYTQFEAPASLYHTFVSFGPTASFSMADSYSEAQSKPSLSRNLHHNRVNSGTPPDLKCHLLASSQKLHPKYHPERDRNERLDSLKWIL